MLSEILGSKLRETILLFLLEGGESYALEITRWFELNIHAVQAQLKAMEEAGILVSWYERGKRFYELESRYYLFQELEALLDKHFRSLPPEGQRRFRRWKSRDRGQECFPAAQQRMLEKVEALRKRVEAARKDRIAVAIERPPEQDWWAPPIAGLPGREIGPAKAGSGPEGAGTGPTGADMGLTGEAAGRPAGDGKRRRRSRRRDPWP